MSLTSWFRGLHALSQRAFRKQSQTRTRRTKQAASHRLALEALETRCLLNAGALDPTFGSAGIVSTSGSADAIVIQPNNDIVIAGTNLARYNPNGSLDTTFANGTATGISSDVPATLLALYPTLGTANDGKIVVVSGNTVERFNANGTIDTTFGSKGVVSVSLPGSDYPLAGLVIQPNGDIVVSGESNNPEPSFILTRLNTNGTLDTTFGTNGTATLAVLKTESYSDAGSLALQADGKLVVAGMTGTVSPGTFWEVARVNTNGTLDTTFNSAGAVPGTVTTYMPAGGQGVFGAALAIYPSTGTDTADFGKIVVAGLDHNSTNGINLAVARYNVNGTPDTSFGQSGLALTSATSGGGKNLGAAIQADGKILATTGFTTGSTLDRFNANGSLDTTFGNGGIVQNAYGPVAIQSNGRIITGDPDVDELAGYLGQATGPTFTITGPTTFTAGASGAFTLTTLNPDGTADTSYSGTVQITSSDPKAALPANLTITGGSGTFNVTLETAGTQSVTATDTTTGSITGSDAGITVTPAAASQVVYTEEPASGTAGQTLGTVEVTLEDAYGNVETGDNSDMVTLNVNGGPSTQMGGTLTETVAAGNAIFSNLLLDTSGSYTLAALANVAGGTLGPVVSSSFTVASPVSWSYGSLTYNSKTKLYSETVTVINTTSGTLTGPMSLELTGLPSGVVLTNATGTTNGNPYIDFLTSGKTLKKGASTSITLTFTDPTNIDIVFAAEVLVGM